MPNLWSAFSFANRKIGMDQYLLIPFLGGWTSIYQLFWCSPGVQGFDTLPIGPLSKFAELQGACGPDWIQLKSRCRCHMDEESHVTPWRPVTLGQFMRASLDEMDWSEQDQDFWICLDLLPSISHIPPFWKMCHYHLGLRPNSWLFNLSHTAPNNNPSNHEHLPTKPCTGSPTGNILGRFVFSSGKTLSLVVSRC